MPRLLKEPLLHFLLLGAALFILFNLLRSDESGAAGASKEIVVTPGRIQTLAAQFAKTWNRPPTKEELDHLITEHVREEILYREALALDLDRDDTIVRRRMRQKIEFLTEDLLTLPQPTDKELTDYLNANSDDYRLDPLFTFEQVFLNPDKRGSTIDADADALLATLRSKGAAADISALGDSLLLQPSFRETPQRGIAGQFGEEFAAALAKLPAGGWEGPVRSGYGLHLVHITERIDGRLPTLDEVRDAIVRDWSNEKRNEANEAFYQTLRDRYTVTVEKEVSGVSVQVSGESK